MMKIDVSTTLAEAVDAFPQLAREFERQGLDYCCGGQRTIGDALHVDRLGSRDGRCRVVAGGRVVGSPRSGRR